MERPKSYTKTYQDSCNHQYLGGDAALNADCKEALAGTDACHNWPMREYLYLAKAGACRNATDNRRALITFKLA